MIVNLFVPHRDDDISLSVTCKMKKYFGLVIIKDINKRNLELKNGLNS